METKEQVKEDVQKALDYIDTAPFESGDKIVIFNSSNLEIAKFEIGKDCLSI